MEVETRKRPRGPSNATSESQWIMFITINLTLHLPLENMGYTYIRKYI